MAGFIRRYTQFPSVDVISLIEGAVIVDLPPPGSVQGVGVGTACCVGEFVDVTYGVSIASDGTISTKTKPVEIFSAQDLLNKVGGFDPTIGEWGVSFGNGFVSIRNKQFSRLVLAPVNLASQYGGRVVRQLPTNRGATDANPVVPMQAAQVLAGTEFRSSNNRVRSAARLLFGADPQYAAGTDGATTATGLPAATQSISSAGADFVALGVVKGDIIVVGVIGEGGAQGTNAATYRVKTVTDSHDLVIERMDGSQFTSGNWATGTALAWRLHPGASADTGGATALSDQGGYTIPCRPLDATIAQSAICSPTIAPPTPTATSWDSLSGLELVATSNAAGIVFTSAVQAPNAVSASNIDALYSAAITSLLADDLPEREVNIVWAARKSNTIRNALKQHVLLASQSGVGRTAVVSPELTVTDVTAATGDSAPGVGATRDERVDYSWPACLTFVPEAVNFSLKGADGRMYANGQIDVPMDAFLASTLSVLAPERNPGEATPTTAAALAAILGVQRGVSGLGINEYTLMRQKGVCGLRMDQTSGPIFQSGITSSLISGQKNINRRRMADYIEDSLAQRYNQFAKQPLTNALKDAIVGETDAFLNQLLSPNNPAAQRINAFEVDDKSGNTPDLEAAGIFVVIVRVRTTPTADFIVLQGEIGENVKITRTQ